MTAPGLQVAVYIEIEYRNLAGSYLFAQVRETGELLRGLGTGMAAGIAEIQHYALGIQVVKSVVLPGGIPVGEIGVALMYFVSGLWEEEL